MYVIIFTDLKHILYWKQQKNSTNYGGDLTWKCNQKLAQELYTAAQVAVETLAVFMSST